MTTQTAIETYIANSPTIIPAGRHDWTVSYNGRLLGPFTARSDADLVLAGLKALDEVQQLQAMNTDLLSCAVSDQELIESQASRLEALGNRVQ